MTTCYRITPCTDNTDYLVLDGEVVVATLPMMDAYREAVRLNEMENDERQPEQL